MKTINSSKSKCLHGGVRGEPWGTARAAAEPGEGTASGLGGLPSREKPCGLLGSAAFDVQTGAHRTAARQKPFPHCTSSISRTHCRRSVYLWHRRHYTRHQVEKEFFREKGGNECLVSLRCPPLPHPGGLKRPAGVCMDFTSESQELRCAARHQLSSLPGTQAWATAESPSGGRAGGLQPLSGICHSPPVRSQMPLGSSEPLQAW